MHKTPVISIAALTIALLAILLIITPAKAQEGGFTETFDDPTLPGWEHSPEAIVVEGALRLNPGNFALRVGDWSDFTMDIRFQYVGPGDLMIHYHFRDESRYTLHFVENALVFEKINQGVSEELGSASLEAFQPENWLNLNVVLSGGQHVISLNENPVLTVADPDPIPPGAFAFHAEGERAATIDDLRVTGGAILPGEPGEAPAGEPRPSEATVTEAAPPTGIGSHPEGVASMLDELLTIQTNQINLWAFMINLLLAAVTSFVLGRVYIHWGTSLSNRRKFASNFMLLTITTTFIILVVRSSVALSLGLVGALSIVRFRAAIKEPEELTYLFFAIGLGIGFGDNQRLITILALAAGILLIGLMRVFRKSGADVNLHVTVASHNPHKIGLDDIVAALRPHCAQMKLMRLDENEAVLEASFLVEFRSFNNLKQAKDALRGLSEFLEITFLDNKGVW